MQGDTRRIKWWILVDVVRGRWEEGGFDAREIKDWWAPLPLGKLRHNNSFGQGVGPLYQNSFTHLSGNLTPNELAASKPELWVLISPNIVLIAALEVSCSCFNETLQRQIRHGVRQLPWASLPVRRKQRTFGADILRLSFSASFTVGVFRSHVAPRVRESSRVQGKVFENKTKKKGEKKSLHMVDSLWLFSPPDVFLCVLTECTKGLEGFLLI